MESTGLVAADKHNGIPFFLTVLLRLLDVVHFVE
jgi:hypothetical protein